MLTYSVIFAKYNKINLNKYKVNQRVFIHNAIFNSTWKIFTQCFQCAKLCFKHGRRYCDRVSTLKVNMV